MIEDIKKLLIPYQCNTLERYGGFVDGGYVYEKNLLEKSKIVYSYGIGAPTWTSFDAEMAEMGKDVYMYDASVTHIANKSQKMHFFKEFVNSSNISSHILSNGHQNTSDMVLKMDIEGNEYETLLNCNKSIFDRFNQLSIEAHNIIDNNPEPKIQLFSFLNSLYKLVHIHGNNSFYAQSSLRKPIDGICDVLELTYIRKDCSEHLRQISNTACPNVRLDAPNHTNHQDVQLDWWTSYSETSQQSQH